MSIEVERLSFSYGRHAVLKDVSFRAEKGEFIFVLGANGVGKSTLFKCMLGLLKPDGGRTLIDGADTQQMTAAKLAETAAYIPQQQPPAFGYTVEEMILMGTAARVGLFSVPGRREQEKAGAAMERLGIAHLRRKEFGRISGGERQLALIARALAQQAAILVLDEPGAGLDFGNRIRVMETLRSLTASGYTILQSTHDPDQAYGYSDKILALKDGETLAWGSAKDVIRSDVISRLYGVETEVCSLREDRVRICLSVENRKTKRGEMKE